MAYYKVNATGLLVGDFHINAVTEVCGWTREQLLSDCTIKEIKNPSVIDLLNSGQKVLAVKRYREIHGGTLSDAKKIVDAIADDISKIRVEKKVSDEYESSRLS